MSGNTIGSLFRLTSFGESHGPGLGGVIDGCPAGLALCSEDVQQELNKRRPGQTEEASTTRQEKDQVQLLSGIWEGVTTGTPIGFYIENTGQKSKDYEHLRGVYRPGHADYSYEAKYKVRDHRGGGRASARETVSRVVGGAVAQKLLQELGVTVVAYTRCLGGIEAELISPLQAQNREYFAPDPSVIQPWKKRVQQVQKAGDSIGGVVEVQALGLPAGLGEPVFDKLDARLAYALMGVGAVKSVDIGAGRDAAELLGSQNNDPLSRDGFSRNNAGGVLGGISSGQPLLVRAGVKPIPSISKPQTTLNSLGQEVSLHIKGRHDVSAIPRIVPVIKAMVCLVLADMWLLQQSSRIQSLRAAE
ncbi:MAG: chorismate synthase [Desulfohalobiaceae bacterium]